MTKITKFITLVSFFLAILFISTTQVQAQSSCKSYSFPNNKKYASCNDLPVLNAHLFWTYNATTGTADIAFRATGVSSSNWVAWALNPTRSAMVGSQALVAYRNSTAVTAYTSAVTAYTITTLTPSKLSFEVSKLSAMARNDDIVIFATMKPPSSTVTQVWQVGPLSSSGTPQGHTPAGDNIKSIGNIDFLSGQSSGGSISNSRQRRKNVHGVLNAVSWGTMMPLGAIIARYLKVSRSAGPAWFYLHVTCQLSAYIIGVAGWGLGLKLGSDSQGLVYHSHRYIGISLFCLATLQVFALLLRPNKDHKYRLYWNIYHHLIGYAVIILSVINVYKGFDILDPEKKWKTTYTCIIIALGAIALVLEAFTWIVVLKRKKDNRLNKYGHHGVDGANGYNNVYGNTA